MKAFEDDMGDTLTVEVSGDIVYMLGGWHFTPDQADEIADYIKQCAQEIRDRENGVVVVDGIRLIYEDSDGDPIVHVHSDSSHVYWDPKCGLAGSDDDALANACAKLWVSKQ